MSNTENLGLPLLSAGQAQKEITHNEALAIVDALAQLTVVSRTNATPPSSPAAGERYIVPPFATGAWTGQTNKIASYVNGWRFYQPKIGWIAYVQDDLELVNYSSSGWTSQYTLENLSDVQLTSPVDADILVYNGSSSRWENVPFPTTGMFVGARVAMSSDHTSSTSLTPIDFSVEAFDTTNFFDTATSTSRFYVPTGFSFVELSAGFSITSASNAEFTFAIRKNGSVVASASGSLHNIADESRAISSGPIDVTTGDYFDVAFMSSSSVTIAASGPTFFAIKAVG